MSELKLPADSGGGSISIKGPSSSSSDVDLLDTTGDLNLKDGKKLKLGDSGDLSIYHDGSHSRIKNTTGYIILNSDTGILLKNEADSESFITCTNNGSVQLAYDGSTKIQTTSEGVLGRGCAHAYGMLDGSGTPHLDNDFGCGAVTDVGTGEYRIALTNNLADNSAIVGVVNARPTSTSNNQMGIGHVYEDNQSSFDISARLVDIDGGTMEYQDWDNIEFAIWDVG